MNHLQHHAQKQCQFYGDFILLFLLLKSLLLFIKRIEIIKHILLNIERIYIIIKNILNVNQKLNI